MLRVVTAALLGLALTTAMPAYAGSGDAAGAQGCEKVEKTSPPAGEVPAGDQVAPQRTADAPTATRYRVGARVEGTYRFTHPSGVPLQVLPYLPGGFPGYGF